MSYIPLLIGCPLYDRGWIIKEWLEYVQDACKVACVEPQFIFACSQDEPTLKSLDIDYHHVVIDEPVKQYERNWSVKRFQHMVDVRNSLLQGVRDLQPTYFLSLDSDILVHEQSILSMSELVDEYDAVGGKLYMSNGTRHPSFSSSFDPLIRGDSDEVLSVKAIMAMKLMNHKAYNIDYSFHRLGEDIGWSKNCKAAGLRLGWDGRVTNKHVMDSREIFSYDKRCGF